MPPPARARRVLPVAPRGRHHGPRHEAAALRDAELGRGPGGGDVGDHGERVDEVLLRVAAVSAPGQELWDRMDDGLVLQKVPSEVNLKVCNHGEGPY